MSFAPGSVCSIWPHAVSDLGPVFHRINIICYTKLYELSVGRHGVFGQIYDRVTVWGR